MSYDLEQGQFSDTGIPISEAPNAEISPLLLGIIKTGRYLAGGGIRMWANEIMSLSVGFNWPPSASSR